MRISRTESSSVILSQTSNSPHLTMYNLLPNSMYRWFHYIMQYIIDAPDGERRFRCECSYWFIVFFATDENGSVIDVTICRQHEEG